MNPAFWRQRRVFVTGHSGFKGRWLMHWLEALGASATGYSLDADDIRDLPRLRAAVAAAKPEIVFHLAAQALVRVSYEEPVATFATNAIGTVHVLEAIRVVPSVRVAVLVTSDKCYANSSGQPRAFREDDVLGGDDPYSASKASAELAIAAYRASFFRDGSAARIFSGRAGNVIGGGDVSPDRLVPDLVRAFRAGLPARVRFPEATRPWQHVLDALHGYLRLAHVAFERDDLPPSFNFGPDGRQSRSVRWLADAMAAQWGDGASWAFMNERQPNEAPELSLDSTRAREVLGWRPLLSPETAVEWTVEWYKSGRDLTAAQIERFMEKAE
ncbi:MAG TPA: CDP-glucose 4,6-dehydratase [Thermoanaerobaculia bacterium]|nr:CDP-glucose 4,6-dehydratase [Thermoanaerobaculia bacterium]